MLNQASLQQVANSSVTSKAIFNALSERERYRDELNLRKFKRDLTKKGEKIVADEYLETFKMLQDLGVGALVIGRRGKPNRFIWDYDLKAVAKNGVGKSSEPIKHLHAEPLKVKRGPGRPRKVNVMVSTPSIKATSPQSISITINLKPGVNSSDVGALLALINDMNK